MTYFKNELLLYRRGRRMTKTSVNKIQKQGSVADLATTLSLVMGQIL